MASKSDLYELNKTLKEASITLHEDYHQKKYGLVATRGMRLLQEFMDFDRTFAPLRESVEVCCPIVSYTGQSLEKLDAEDKAIELYSWIIHRGCMGTLPFTRLAILLERQSDYSGAIGVCDKAIENKWFYPSTAKAAEVDFSKRKARLEKKMRQKK